MQKNKSFPLRYRMVIGTFILALIVLFDRIMISVAKDPIAADLSLSDEQMGWVMSIFALGYALFQTPSGILADKFGARRVLSAVVSLWSLFTALTGAVYNYVVLLVVRFLFGAGEAGAFPGISRAMYKWIPVGERGLVHGINFSGGRLGAAVALPLTAWLIDASGWRMSFVILGSIGVLWAIIWYAWFRDNPEDQSQMSAEELAYIKAHTKQEEPAETAKVNYLDLFRSRNMWLIMGQYFCSNFTFFFCLTWLFPHLKVKYGLDTMEAGFYSAAPLVFGAIGNWVSGWLVDKIYRQGRWEFSRKWPAIIGFSLAAIGVLVSVYMTEVSGAIFFISMAVFGADMTLSPSWSTCIDLGQEHSGAVSGTMNMAGNLGSFLTALAFPYMLSLTGSDKPFFFLTAALNLLAIPIWLSIQPRNPIELTKV